MGDMRSVIRGVMLDSDPAEPAPKGVIAGRIVPTQARRLPDLAVWVRAAAAVLPAVVLGLALWRGLSSVSTPAAPAVAEPSPVVVERVVEVQVIVTATPVEQGAGVRGQGLAPSPQPPAPAQVAPRQVAPQVQAQVQAPAPRAVQPTPRPQVQAQQRPASVQVQAAPTVKPTATLHERILGRNCQFPDAPQGTVIRGYYTDASGVKRDAVCKLDGWKAVD